MNPDVERDPLPKVPAVTALYRSPDHPDHNPNELIDVLPPLGQSDDRILAALRWMPTFSVAETRLPNAIRIVRLMQLQKACIPVTRQLEVVHTLDALLHASYANRTLDGPEQARIAQELYALRHAGVAFANAPPEGTGLCAGFFGGPGDGKSTTVKRWAQGVEKVIFHPKHHIYQVPVLIAEAPQTSKSFRGLCYSILRELDARIPKANYYRTFGIQGKPNDDVLLRNAVDRCNEHFVGLLVIDETQNLKNYGKGGETLLSELVGAMNTIHAGTVFVGTNSAVNLVTKGFHGGRRVVSTALPLWKRFPEKSEGDSGEDEFAEIMLALWLAMIIRFPPELDERLLAAFYNFTQGILAIMVALFAACQREAIESGTETITVESIAKVYETRFKPIHPVIDALREGNEEAIRAFEDVASPLTKMLWRDWEQESVRTEGAPSTRPAEPEAPKPKRRAQIRSRMPQTGARRGKQKSDTEPYADIELARGDFRLAVRNAYREKTTAYEQLIALGLAPSSAELLAMF